MQGGNGGGSVPGALAVHGRQDILTVGQHFWSSDGRGDKAQLSVTSYLLQGLGLHWFASHWSLSWRFTTATTEITLALHAKPARPVTPWLLLLFLVVAFQTFFSSPSQFCHLLFPKGHLLSFLTKKVEAEKYKVPQFPKPISSEALISASTSLLFLSLRRSSEPAQTDPVPVPSP